MKYGALLLCVWGVTLLWGGTAEAFRCSKGIIAEGATKPEVLNKCGPPAFQDKRVEERVGKSPSGETVRSFITVEEWTYDSGPNRFIRIVVFEGGRVVQIRTGGYGGRK